MPPVPLIVKIIEGPPMAELSGRAHTRSMVEAHRELGNHWSHKILPGRFRPFSAGHAERRPSTKRRKRKQGKLVDLVDKGLAQSIALENHFVRAYPTRATVVIPGPSYFRINFRDPTRINLVKEVLYVTPTQQDKLGRVALAKYEHQLQVEAKAAPKKSTTFK